jgi:hypothetical protein
MDMDIQHGRGHISWTTCSMDVNILHEQGHEYIAWTWTCSMDADMQNGHRYVAWTWACSMDMDIDMHHGHAAWHGHGHWHRHWHGHWQFLDKHIRP